MRYPYAPVASKRGRRRRRRRGQRDAASPLFSAVPPLPLAYKKNRFVPVRFFLFLALGPLSPPRLSKEFAALKDRRELLSGDSSSVGVSVASDVSLDARVRQLAQEARFNARLRAQQQRIRELVEQNKVCLVVGVLGLSGCALARLPMCLPMCLLACVRVCLRARLLAFVFLPRVLFVPLPILLWRLSQ